MSLKKQIEELERRVKELEARPITYPPVFIPYPVPQPFYIPPPVPYYPAPWPPYPYGPIYTTTCGDAVPITGNGTVGILSN